MARSTKEHLKMDTRDHTDPKRSVHFIDVLKPLGFPNSAFAIIHHSANWEDRGTMEGHRAYCFKVGSFQANSTNSRVQQRLELILNAYEHGGFKSEKPEVFEALARAAVAEIPL